MDRIFLNENIKPHNCVDWIIRHPVCKSAYFFWIVITAVFPITVDSVAKFMLCSRVLHYKTPFCRGQNLKTFTEVIPSCTLSHVPYKVPTSFDLIKGKTFYLTAEAKILDYLEYISNKTIPSHLKNIMLKLILYSIVSFGLANN